MESTGKFKWQKRFGMVCVITWLLLHVAGAQYLVDLVKSESAGKWGYLVAIQYIVQTLQFLVGALVWDVLKKIHNSKKIDWPSVWNAVKEMATNMLIMSAFFIAAIASLSSTVPWLAGVFVVAYIRWGWKLGEGYISFVSKIKEGIN